MSNDQGPLLDIVKKLEDAWNHGDSVAWTTQFADDADFIHILGGHFHGTTAIERGHRAIFDTIYKASRNKFTVEKVRFVNDDVALVFVFAELTWYLKGAEQHIQARPTLLAQKNDSGQWQIVAFQNTLITPGGPAPDVVKKLTEAHPIKGDTELKK